MSVVGQCVGRGLSKSPATRRSLLWRIRDTQDESAWSEFVDIYAPLVHAYCCRRGVQDADAADLAQRVLSSVAIAVPEFDYDSSKGSFRGWLFTITRNHLLKLFQTQSREVSGTGDSKFHRLMAQHPDDSFAEDEWNTEYQTRLLHLSMEKAEPEFKTTTWQAFCRSSIDGEKPQQIATALGISVGAVYIARNRVKSRLREIVAKLDAH